MNTHTLALLGTVLYEESQTPEIFESDGRWHLPSRFIHTKPGKRIQCHGLTKVQLTPVRNIPNLCVLEDIVNCVRLDLGFDALPLVQKATVTGFANQTLPDAL